MSIKILKGHIVYTENPLTFTIKNDGYLVYNGKEIVGVYDALPKEYDQMAIEDLGDVLVIPGFYDLHLHSGQYPQCGVGMDHQLLDWLKDYTYELERKFEDRAFAQRVYRLFVDDLSRYGTLGASVFATTAYTGTDELFQAFIDKGLRGLIGKVCMECYAPTFIVKDHETNIGDVVKLAEKYDHQELVQSIITPRFAPTSTSESLEELGQLAAKYNLPVQSHIDENMDEIKWVQELYGVRAYATVYNDHGLYGQQPTLMAHGIYLSDEEIALTKKNDVILVHCPDSNLNIRSGIMPVRKYLNEGIRIGLGTDIAGGHKISMTEAIVRCIQLSKQLSLMEPAYDMIKFSEAFYMATAVGGSFFGNVGQIKEGFEMDCLVIDDPLLYKELYSVKDRLEKFVYTGDDRWIAKRYVAGKLIE